MGNFADLISKNTKIISPPVEPVITEPTKKETVTPITEEKKETVTQQTQPQAQTITDEDYETAGEAKAAMYAFILEAPLSAYNGVSYRLRKKKANKILDKTKREAELKKIEKTFAANKGVINLDDKEFDRLHQACTAISKLNKSVEINPTLSIATAIIGILVKRAEMLVDDE